MLLTASTHKDRLLDDVDYYRRLYKRHVQGALVRSGACLFMWLVAWVALFIGVIESNHFTGVSISILYLILINPPTLWVMKKLTDRRLIELCSLVINGSGNFRIYRHYLFPGRNGGRLSHSHVRGADYLCRGRRSEKIDICDNLSLRHLL